MIKEELERLGFFTFQHTDELFNEIKGQCMEMGQLKSDFDIEKFTVKKEGNFIAHNFHFLMRQYSLALSELRRMLIEKEEIERKINETKETIKEGIAEKEKVEHIKLLINTKEGRQEKYADLYIKELINQLDLLEINIVNKAMMVREFEICRLKLIEINNGKSPTNEDYQKEEPIYLKWLLENKAVWQWQQARTGISEGIWENISMLERPALINPEFQVKMLENNGEIALSKIAEKLNSTKNLDYESKKQLENL